MRNIKEVTKELFFKLTESVLLKVLKNDCELSLSLSIELLLFYKIYDNNMQSHKVNPIINRLDVYLQAYPRDVNATELLYLLKKLRDRLRSQEFLARSNNGDVIEYIEKTVQHDPTTITYNKEIMEHITKEGYSISAQHLGRILTNIGFIPRTFNNRRGYLVSIK